MKNIQQKQQIFTGYDHSFILTTDHEIYVTGRNVKGQLGLSHNNNQIKYIKNEWFIDRGIQIKDIICGGFHTFFVSTKNEVYCSGSNNSGQLGMKYNEKVDETERNVYPPIKHPFFDGLNMNNKIFKIFCGKNSTYVLIEGKVWSFGSNMFGELGQGKLGPFHFYTPRIIKEEMFENEYVMDIFVSFCSEHVYYITKNDKIFGNGKNENGQLGLNHVDEVYEPRKLKLNFLKKKEKVSSIVVGQNRSFFLTNTNELFSSGRNSYGSLGIGKSDEEKDCTLVPLLISHKFYKNEKIVNIYVGHYFTFFQTTKNIYAFGFNGFGQFGGIKTQFLLKPKKVLPKFKNIVYELNVSESNLIILTKNGKLFSVGDNEYGQIGIDSKEFSHKEMTQVKHLTIRTFKEEERKNVKYEYDPKLFYYKGSFDKNNTGKGKLYYKKSQERFVVFKKVKDILIYEGEMVEGKKHGKGKLFFPEDSSKIQFHGNFIADKKDGSGIEYDLNGKTVKKGNWKDDKITQKFVY